MKFSIKGFFSKYDQIRRKLYWRNPEWKTSFFVQWKLRVLCIFLFLAHRNNKPHLRDFNQCGSYDCGIKKFRNQNPKSLYQEKCQILHQQKLYQHKNPMIGNLDILIVTEINIKEWFPSFHFLSGRYSLPYKLDINRNRSGVLNY